MAVMDKAGTTFQWVLLLGIWIYRLRMGLFIFSMINMALGRLMPL